MNKITTVFTLAMLGATSSALAADLDGGTIDELAGYAQSLDERDPGEDAVQHRSGKRPPARGSGSSSKSKGKGSSAGRPSSSQRGSGDTASRPNGGPSRGSSAGAPNNQGQRPSASGGSRPPSGGSRPGATAARPNGARPGAIQPGAGRPTSARSGVSSTARHSTAARHQGHTVVHGRPAVAHSRPSHVVHGHRPTVVHRNVHTVRYAHVYPYHGVFVYGPRPVTHVHYVQSGPGPVRVQKKHLPERAIDRDHSFAVGLKGGSMISGTPDGGVYGDPGLGLVGRYRPAEPVALELGVGHHSSAFASSRSQTQVAGSVELFVFPWTRVSPYMLGGVTWNSARFAGSAPSASPEAPSDRPGGAEREVDLGTAGSSDSQWGLHGGLGVEFGLGKSVALDLEGRYIGWVDERTPGEAPGAIQATAGLLVHFK